VAKDLGRNRVQSTRPDDDASRRHGEMQWVQRLNEGSAATVSVCTGSASRTGRAAKMCEILLGSDEPGKPLIPPSAYPGAERYYLMPAIDRWWCAGVRHACAARQIPDSFRASVYSSTSPGSRCATTSFSTSWSALRDSRIAPQRICFEITETAAIANLSRRSRSSPGFRTLGCRFALDDFGSGVSSFRYLRTAVDYLKIAGNFIQDIATTPVDMPWSTAINQIATSWAQDRRRVG